MKHRLVTAAMSDSLLEYLMDNFPLGQLITVSNVNKMLADTGLAFNELNAMLEDFERLGLIGSLNARRVAIHLAVTKKLHDFFEKGGFSGDLAKLKHELVLLQAQISGLGAKEAKEASTTINNVLQIISGLTMGLLGKY